MKYKVVDLFAGAGGLSNGFCQTGKFDILAAVENNANIRKTYRRNHPETEMYEDVKKINFSKFHSKYGEIDIVIGGPPCQGFSNANRQKNYLINSNNQLVKAYIKAIMELKPKVFIMENVSMLNSKTHRFYNSYDDSYIVRDKCIDINDESLYIDLPNCNNDILLQEIRKKKKFEVYIIDKKQFTLLNSLYKKKHNLEKFNESKVKNMNKILMTIDQIIKYYNSIETDKYTERLVKILKVIKKHINLNDKRFIESLEQFVLYIRMFLKLKEINDYNLVVDKYEYENNCIKITIKSYSVIDYILHKLNSNYRTVNGILNAANYGAPQLRERFILMGVRKDIKTTNEIKLPDGFIDKEAYFTVKDAIRDLQNSYPEKDVKLNYIVKKNKRIKRLALGKYLCNSNEIHNHINTNTTDVALKRFKTLKEGQNFHDLDKGLKTTYSLPERTQNSIYLRLKYSQPSGTVLNVRKSMWIHPKIDRALSIREAARLQTFQDSYIFEGTKDWQYQQIGNAVPPILARAIAEKVLEIMGDEPETYLKDELSY